MSTRELSFITQLFILIGPACESIQKWGDFSTVEDMMNRMTKNFRCFERFQEMAPNRIRIGTMIVAKPHSRMLKMAMSLAIDLGPLFADMTLGLLQKYLALVIYRKTQFALHHHIKISKSVSLTAGIKDILMAKPDDYANTADCGLPI